MLPPDPASSHLPYEVIDGAQGKEVLVRAWLSRCRAHSSHHQLNHILHIHLYIPAETQLDLVPALKGIFQKTEKEGNNYRTVW